MRAQDAAELARQARHQHDEGAAQDRARLAAQHEAMADVAAGQWQEEALRQVAAAAKEGRTNTIVVLNDNALNDLVVRRVRDAIEEMGYTGLVRRETHNHGDSAAPAYHDVILLDLSWPRL